ncbi:hypothetical protein LSAT2_008744 [Lamellibrachia satsuma]|nr:hypothetical protein LSAT2_008744 [Lamellibrachia satsuma]
MASNHDQIGQLLEAVSRIVRNSSTPASATGAPRQQSQNMPDGDARQIELRQLFQSNQRSRPQRWPRRARALGQPVARSHVGTFYRNVFLLPGPDVTTVPRQSAKVDLVKAGFKMDGVHFQKEWTGAEVVSHIRQLFTEVIPPDADVEILVSVHFNLIQPRLELGQTLDGAMLNRIFKDKPVYVRPSVELRSQMGTSNESVASHTSPEEKDVLQGTSNESVASHTSPEEKDVLQGTSNESVASHISPEEKDVLQGTSNESVASHISPEKEDDLQGTLNEEVCLPSITLTTRQSRLETTSVPPFVYEELFVEEAFEWPSTSYNNDDMEVEDHHEDNTLLADILRQLEGQINIDLPKNMLNVWRGNILEGARLGFTRKKFNPCAPLDVVFADSAAVLGGEGIAEGAVDAGGPQREFLTLCMQAIEQGPCFTGESKILTRDATALARKDYFVCGRIMAVSLCVRGPTPSFLAPVLYHGLAFGTTNTPVKIEDLPDGEIKVSLMQMQDVLEPASFLEALDQPEHKALSTTVDNGGTMGVLRTQEDVAKVIGRTCHYMVFGRTADAFQQLQDGLSTLGVLEAMKQHPAAFEKVFTVHSVALTMRQMIASFTPVFSESDSSERHVEMRVVNHWHQFLQRVEGTT